MDLDSFFAREPFGFSTDTLIAIWDDVRESLSFLSQLAVDWWSRSLPDKTTSVAILVGLLLGGWIGLRLDRRLRRLVRDWSRRLSLPGPAQLTELTAIVVRVLGTLVVPGALLILSYVLLRGAFDDAEWTVLCSDVLLLWMLFRGLASSAREILRPDVIEMTDEHAAQNRRMTLAAVWLVVMFRLGHAVVADLEYRSDAIALLDFMFRLSLTLLAVRVAFMRETVLDLLPEVGPTIYRRFRAIGNRFYVHILSFTAALGLLWTFGYERAAGALAERVYLGLGALVAIVLVFRRLQSYLEGEPPEGQQRPLPIQLVEAAGRFLRFFVLVLIVILALHIAGIYDPLMAVLGAPLVSFGEVEGSVLTVFTAIVVLLGFLMASRITRKLMELRLFPRLELEEGVAYAISSMVHYLLLTLGVVAALLSTGLDLSAFGIFAGALGVGIGFGLQEMVRNLVSGFVLLFGRAIKKGDFITVGGEFGQVTSVGARSVGLRTRDNVELLVPCSDLVNNTIVNYTHTSPNVRLHFRVGVSYNADPKLVREVLLASALASQFIHKHPAPIVWLTGFADSAVEYELVAYANIRQASESHITGELNFIFWDKLHEAGIEIPFPQRDLHLKSIEPKVVELASAAGGSRTS